MDSITMMVSKLNNPVPVEGIDTKNPWCKLMIAWTSSKFNVYEKE